MKRVKPGRGPSMMSAAGSVFAAIFGVVWTILAISMGAPFFFPLFGIFFIVMAAVQGFYHYKNATGKERYSAFDIVDDTEEGDPLDRWARQDEDESRDDDRRKFDVHIIDRCEDGRRAGEPAEDGEEEVEVNFCPYCGAKAEKAFRFCQSCGKRLR